MFSVALSAILRCVSGAFFAEGATAAEGPHEDREPKLFCFASFCCYAERKQNGSDEVEMFWKSALKLLI
jgi:hypothetical protein